MNRLKVYSDGSYCAITNCCGLATYVQKSNSPSIGTLKGYDYVSHRAKYNFENRAFLLAIIEAKTYIEPCHTEVVFYCDYVGTIRKFLKKKHKIEKFLNCAIKICHVKAHTSIKKLSSEMIGNRKCDYTARKRLRIQRDKYYENSLHSKSRLNFTKKLSRKSHIRNPIKC